MKGWLKIEKEIQSKQIELQLMDVQIKQLQKQMQMIDTQILDLNATNLALEDLKDTKQGAEMLAPIAGGIFVESELKDNKEVLVNVGAGVGVKKNIDETKKLIEEQANELNKQLALIIGEIQRLGSEAAKLEKELSGE